MVNKADTILALLAKSQQDPAVYEEPTLFRPERMLSANFNNLPKNAWKPFGTGVRSVSTQTGGDPGIGVETSNM